MLKTSNSKSVYNYTVKWRWKHRVPYINIRNVCFWNIYVSVSAKLATRSQIFSFHALRFTFLHLRMIRCVRTVHGETCKFSKTWIWRTASPATPVFFASLGQTVTRWHFGAVYAQRASWMHFLLRHYALVLFAVRFPATQET